MDIHGAQKRLIIWITPGREVSVGALTVHFLFRSLMMEQPDVTNT